MAVLGEFLLRLLRHFHDPELVGCLLVLYVMVSMHTFAIGFWFSQRRIFTVSSCCGQQAEKMTAVMQSDPVYAYSVSFLLLFLYVRGVLL